MRRTLIAVALASMAAAVPSLHGQGPGTAPAAATRHIYITAVDKSGSPVKDLAPGEVRVREDGTNREVVAVQPADAPLTIALLVDDTGPGLRYIREGAGQFIQRLAGRAEVTLVSTAKNITLVDYTNRVDALYAAVRQLTTQNTATAVDGAYLLDAAHDAMRTLQQREAERPVLVVLTLETTEFSSRRANALLDELQRCRATLYAVSLGKPTLKTMTGWNEGPMQSLRENLDETGNRRNFLENGTKRSGGRFEQVLIDSGVPGAMTAIADELASQYVVMYSHGASQQPARRIEVSVARAGARVRKAGGGS